MASTIAERFCADQNARLDQPQYQGAQMAVSLDDSADIRFPDGSAASCLNGGPWLSVALDDNPGTPPVSASWRGVIMPLRD
jgi:hypothetical protein